MSLLQELLKIIFKIRVLKNKKYSNSSIYSIKIFNCSFGKTLKACILTRDTVSVTASP